MNLIQLTNIRKFYNKNKVLDIESLKVDKGDRLIITGSNGSGKTTLLKIISGVIKNYQGTVIKSDTFKSMKVVYVPHNGGLYPNLTLQENLIIYKVLYNISDTKYTDTIINDLHLTTFINNKILELSAGYKKLSALACALSVSPNNLFLDEPFSNLENSKIELIKSKLKIFIESVDYGSLIITSHNSDNIDISTRTFNLSK